MIRLRTLGAIEVEGHDGRPLGSVLRQPKRLALLAYLALARPRGFQRRDTLLGLFWPELDERRARHALSQALHGLRHSLGEGVVVIRGSEEVGLDPERLWCDAVAFEEAFAEGDFARALGLYRGNALAGFILSDALEFEQWLAGERLRLRQTAIAAAWKQSEAAESACEPGLAAHWARCAVQLSQDDEPSARRLIALLDRAGDRAGALRAYAEFAESLRDEYGVEPSSETRALIEEVRQADLPARAQLARTEPPESALHHERAEVDTPALQRRPEPIQRPSETAPLHFSAARRLEPAWAWSVGVVVALGAIGMWVATQRGAPGGEPSAIDRVAVLPFHYQGDNSHAYLADGMATLLSSSLNGAGDLRSVDGHALQNAVERAASGRPGPGEARIVARRFDAGLFILGNVVETGGRLRIMATLYDATHATERVIGQITEEGGAEELFGLVDRLTARLLAGRSAARGDELGRTAALTTTSLPALKAHLEGDRDYRAGRYAPAVIAFQRAVELDTTFALAHYRLSSAANWVNQSELAVRAARAAVQHGDRLSEADRLLVMAWERAILGDPTRAEKLYRAALSIRPDDVEAWFQLGEILFHWQPILGRSAVLARPAFERVLAYEPNHVGALMHLLRIAGSEARGTDVDSLAARILRLRPGAAQALEVSALQAYAVGDRLQQVNVLARLEQAADGVPWEVLQVIAAHAGNPAGAADMARHLAAPGHDAVLRAYATIMVVQIEAARGRRTAASAALDELARTQPDWALQFRAAYTIPELVPVQREELEAIRADLEGEPKVPWPGENPPAPRPILPPRRHYLAGIANVRLDDSFGALRHAVEIERLRRDTRFVSYGHTFGPTVRAWSAWRQHRPKEALELLGEPRVPPGSLRPHISSFPRADERFLRARILEDEGRLEEALAWYATFPDPGAYDLVYLAPSHLYRAKILEQLDQPVPAAAHYRRFLELWNNADPAFDPLLEQARARLRRLEG